MARKAYHLEGACGAESGVFKPLKWWQALDDKHGYKTVIKSTTCSACFEELKGILDAPDTPIGD